MESDAEFVERMAKQFIAYSIEDMRDYLRLFALARRGAAVQWRPMTREEVILDLERMDAGGELCLYEIADDRGLTIEEYANRIMRFLPPPPEKDTQP